MSHQHPPDTGRTFEITAEAQVISGMKKEARIHSRDLDFTITSDEGPAVGGEGSAPTPMQYFVAGVAF